MDNLSLYPPGVGPQDDFDFQITGKSKFYKDPRLSKQFENSVDKDQTNRNTSSPSKTKRSEERYEKRDKDRSLDRSPKRSRDRYGERYDREDSYERRSSHRSRRTPSSSPQSKRSRQSRDSQQYDRRSYRNQSENQFVDNSHYNSNNYQTQYPQAPPQGYGNQVPQFPAYMGSSGNDGFLPNSYMGSNYIAPAATHAPPSLMPNMMSGPPPPPEPPEAQWGAIQTSNPLPVQTADKMKREAAIASEKRQQRVTLLKQRDEYLRKVNNLKRELKVLKDQRSELKGTSRTPPSPDTYRFLKENSKLQVEISNKLKTMNNVIEMLSGIIGEEGGESDKEKKSVNRSPVASPEQSSKNGDRSFSSDRSSKQNYNYIHYDPEMHWCQVCDVFPKTAKEYLQHLHDPEHLLNIETGPGLEAPWHEILDEDDDEPPAISGAMTKRLPIRGLQHFIASPAWFCKLCNKWIGDLHCASAHLKSKRHAKSYARFTEQNPHWETDWMADRQKAYERFCNKNPEKKNQDSSLNTAADTSEIKSKKKHSKKEKKNKKKSKKHKKSKSSSSETSTESESDSSSKISEDKASSIRVAMRNKLKQAELIMQEKANSGKWTTEKNEERTFKKTDSPQKPERDDKMLMQWMANKGVLTESDKKMFEALRMRLKNRQEVESNKEVEFRKATPQPSVIPLIREQAEAAARKQREAEAEAEALKEREKYEAERENERREKERREREKERDRDYYRDREPRSYYRDRRRSPGDYRNRYYDKRYSRSPDRDRRHYRSRSPEYRSRVEVGVIVNPPPAPKPVKYDKKKYKNVDADSSDEKEKSKQKQQQQTNKKLPFIGRMPVFKAKLKDDSPKNTDDDSDKKTGLEKAIQKRDEINAQIKKAMEEGTIPSSNMPIEFNNGNDSDQMFADMAPPPPNISYEDPPIGFVTQQELPPGIESPSALDEIKIPINAAPPNKQLPKDFADALDIIFPGDKKPDSDIQVAPVAPPPPIDVMPMMVPAYPLDTQQYSDYTFALPTSGYESAVVQEHQPLSDQPLAFNEPPQEEVKVAEEKIEHPEMDDLAMLGIDESDITAQHF